MHSIQVNGHVWSLKATLVYLSLFANAALNVEWERVHVAASLTSCFLFPTLYVGLSLRSLPVIYTPDRERWKDAFVVMC